MAPKKIRSQVKRRTSKAVSDRILKKLAAKETTASEVEKLISEQMINELSSISPRLPIVKTLSREIIKK